MQLPRRLLVLLAVSVAALVGAAGARAAVNLPNTSFEGSLGGWRGYNASLALTTGGALGTSAARVSRNTSSSSFSIYPSPRPVSSTVAGATYSAAAYVRSVTPGRRLCLRIREWSSTGLAGSAETCLTGTTAWQAFAPLSYKAVGDGRSLDFYVYESGALAGDSFDVDGATLAEGTTAPTPPPPPPPSEPAPAPPSAGMSAAAVDHAHIRLSWAAVAGATGYRVFRGALHVGSTPATSTSFTDALLWPMSSYSYRVEATGTSVAMTATAATAVLPVGGFPRPFAPTSFWNTPIPAGAPLASNNAGLSSYLGSHARNPNLALHDWAVAVSEAHPNDQLYSVPCTMYACTLNAFGAFRIPVTAQPDPSGDGHLAVYDPVAQREWGMWQARRTSTGWSASAGAAVSMTGNGVAPAGYGTGNAANFPLLGGLIRPEEIKQGFINHALVIGVPGIGKGRPVCPATHNAPTSTDPYAPREGHQIQLDPSIDVNSLPIPAWQRPIARALQVYGAYVRDNSGALALYAENPLGRGYDAWTYVGLGGVPSASLSGIPWHRFRFIASPDC